MSKNVPAPRAQAGLPVAAQPQLPVPAKKQKKKGDDGWSARGHIRFGLFCLLILVGGFGGWAATAKLASAVVATGQLRVEAQQQVVNHPDGGVVGEIFVRDGDYVEGGQDLIRLDGSRLESELAALESQLFEIMAREGRLVAEQAGDDQITFDKELLDLAAVDGDIRSLVEGQMDLFNARRETMASELEVMGERQVQIEEQIEGTKAEVASLVRQTELIDSELKDMRQLEEKGLVRRDRLMSLERERARLTGEYGSRTAQAAQLKGQISELEMEKIRMKTSRIEESITQLREIGYRKFELLEERLQLKEQLSRLSITAPRSGVVYDMKVHALKSVIRPAEPVLHLIPTDTGLVVDARVQTIDIDHVHMGQEAVLRFSAFSSRNTPELFGTVIKISADAFMDEQTGAQFYKVEVKFDDNELAKLEGQELVAGMPVETFIQTGERTPIDYLMKPMTDYFNRSLREPG